MTYPELPAEIKRINRQLESHFGVNTDDMRPIWRVSWSDDQIEKRMTNTTKSGLILLSPIVAELPKYQWIKERWILERLVVVPEIQQTELLGLKVSYECIWNFSGKGGGPVQPNFPACEFIIHLVHSAQGKGNMAKYVDPDLAPDAQMKRIQQLELELFGDESGLEGKTFRGEGIVVPQSYESTQTVK